MYKFLWKSHWLMGWIAGLVLAIVSLSGAMIAFEPQLSAWSEKDSRLVRNCIADPSLGVASGLKQFSRNLDATIQPQVRGWTVWNDPCQNLALQVGRQTLYVDPHTLAKQGQGSVLRGLLHGVEEFHRWFLIKTPGKQIVGAATLVLGMIVISGLALMLLTVVRARFSFHVIKKQIVPLDPRKRSFALWARSWHLAIGFWLCLPMMLIVTTGLVINYEWANKALFSLAGTPSPNGESPKPMNGKASNPFVIPEWDRLNVSALSELSKIPSWKSATLRVPRKSGDPWALVVEVPSQGFMARQTLQLDRMGQIVKVQTWQEIPQGQKWRSWIVPLHTGRAWGLWGQSIALLTALAVAFLSISGLILAGQRARRGRVTKAVR